MAPEIYAGFSYSYPVDYWALGILMFEMLYSLRPYQGTNEEQLRKMITEDPVIFPRQLTGSDVPSCLKDLICELLNKCQDDRLQSFRQMESHEAFAQIDWEALREKRLTPGFLPDNSSPTINFDSAYLSWPVKLEHVAERINPNVATAFESFDEVISET